MTQGDTIETLNDLLETSRDGEYGFNACAEHVKSADLRVTLMQRAQECQLAARELAALIAQLNGTTADGGTAVGAMHRGWVSVRAVLSTATDQAMLNECERAEDRALARYRAALKADLTPEARALVERQCTGVQRNHDLIRDLRDRHAAS